MRRLSLYNYYLSQLIDHGMLPWGGVFKGVAWPQYGGDILNLKMVTKIDSQPMLSVIHALNHTQKIL